MDDLPFTGVQGKPDNQQSINNSPKPTIISGHPEKELTAENYLEKVEKEPKLPSEVKPWLRPLGEEIKLSPQDKKVGMEEIGEIVPVSTQPTQAISLPFTDDQVDKAMHQKITESLLWLVAWWLRKLQMMHRKFSRIGSSR